MKILFRQIFQPLVISSLLDQNIFLTPHSRIPSTSVRPSPQKATFQTLMQHQS